MATPVPDRVGALRRTGRKVLMLVAAALAPAVAFAQPIDLPLPLANTTSYPPGVSVAQSPAGPVYVDAKGHTLYGLDLRTLLRWGPNPAAYCKDRCDAWSPLLAPADTAIDIAYPKGFGEQLRNSIASGTPARPPAMPVAIEGAPPFYSDPLKAPDWTVIAGPSGPQRVYKGWHMVYVRKGDGRASTRYDGAENLTWNTLKYAPGAPRVEAPGGVRAILADGAYVLADMSGHALFTGTCPAPCPAWKPLAGGMASAGSGAWQISNTGDRPQWTYRGRPVFISQEADPTSVPPATEALRP